MSINALGIIFSNMHDEEMQEITNCRTMGALPFGGRYRLIDFPLSCMHNSGITSVGVIAKSNYQSLIEHLGSGKEWDLSRKRDGLCVFPPFSRLSSGIYKNKIEALNGVITYIKKSRFEYVVITDCDIICNINWEKPLHYHISKNADITVLYCPIEPDSSLKSETLYTISQDGFVTDIRINQEIKEPSLVGTNMWIIKKEFLIHLINDAVAHNLEDIERDIIQKKLNQYRIAAWKVEGYVRKTNSIYSYFKANMDILNTSYKEDLFYKNGPIYTKVMDEYPTKYSDKANVTNCLIADGCTIEGQVENSIIFRGVTIGKGASVRNSIIMNGTNVGDNVSLDYVLSDKNVIFKENRKLVGCDSRPFYINKGSVI
jgi:glucose-1-phosphate adenylyltransferase